MYIFVSYILFDTLDFQCKDVRFIYIKFRSVYNKEYFLSLKYYVKRILSRSLIRLINQSDTHELISIIIDSLISVFDVTIIENQ